MRILEKILLVIREIGLWMVIVGCFLLYLSSLRPGIDPFADLVGMAGLVVSVLLLLLRLIEFLEWWERRKEKRYYGE